MSENIKNKAVKGVIWSFVDQFSGQIIQFIISIILARLLLPSDYGIVGMLGFFMAISGVFIDAGFSSALIQRKDRSEKDLNTVFYLNMVMAIACYLFMALFARLIANFFNQPLLVPIIYVYCLTLIIGAAAGINNTLLTINIDFKTKSKISIISAISSGSIGIGCAYFGLGVWALVIQGIASTLFNTILNFYYVRWFPKWFFSIESFKSLFSYGSKLLASGLIAAAYTNIYTLVVGKQFNSAILGFYSRAQGFTNLTSNNINNIVSRVSFPILSKVQDDNEVLLDVYGKYIRMSSFIIFPIVLLLCGIAKPLILVLLTDKWAMSIGLLQILCFSCIWNGIVDINLNLLKVKGRTDLVLKLEVIKKTIAFTILVISVLFDNIYIICWGLSFYSLIALYLNTIYTKRLLGLGFTEQFKLFSPYLLLSFFIMIIALLLSNYIPNIYISLITSIIVCPCIYLYMTIKLKLFAGQEMKKILARMMGKFKHK